VARRRGAPCTRESIFLSETWYARRIIVLCLPTFAKRPRISIARVCAIVVALACAAMIECVICERNFPRFGGKVAGAPVRIRFTREKRQTALAANVGMQYRNKRVSRAHSE